MSMEISGNGGEAAEGAVKIGERIRLRRTELDWTRDELGEKLHLSGHAIGKWEQGNQAVPSRRMAALAACLGVTEKWLATGLGEKFPDASRNQHPDAGLSEPDPSQDTPRGSGVLQGRSDAARLRAQARALVVQAEALEAELLREDPAAWEAIAAMLVPLHQLVEAKRQEVTEEAAAEPEPSAPYEDERAATQEVKAEWFSEAEPEEPAEHIDAPTVELPLRRKKPPAEASYDHEAAEDPNIRPNVLPFCPKEPEFEPTVDAVISAPERTTTGEVVQRSDLGEDDELAQVEPEDEPRIERDDE